MSEPKVNVQMEKIVALCKRRGFIFQSSEIYGGINGFWDYGPLGAELKRNVKESWWRAMTQRDDVVGLDASIIMHPRVWEASGHTTTFNDPMVDCLLTKKRFRADQIEPMSGDAYFWSGARDEQTGREIREPYSALIPTGKHADSARKLARHFYQQRGLSEPALLEERKEAVVDSTRYNPENGSLVTEPRQFNLMLKTWVGPVQSDEDVAYLRPETAQAIFAQFKTILEVSRQKVPFGICQIGKAFRNEINPRNFTFRSREFEQMELEFFIKPDDVAQAELGAPPEPCDLATPLPNWGWKEWLHYWVEERVKWYEAIGLGRDTLELYWQKREELAHYARACVDIQFKFPFGAQELEGIAARGDYDLARHQEFSGKSMEYFDEEARARYIPHVIEPSAGVDRTVLALICQAYAEDEVPDEKGKPEARVLMRFHPRIAPVKVGVFPLLKNRPELVKKAREVRQRLRPHLAVFYDEAGAIGRRYRRQDEAGTPFGVTIDFDTLGESGPALKDTVTVRDRDTTKQDRVKIDELLPLLLEKVS